MNIYPPFMPKETNLKGNEYAFFIFDVRDMYKDALEKDSLHRYALIGLYYYRYIDEYNQIIDGIFERNMWHFPVINHCNKCGQPIIFSVKVPPIKRAATHSYNLYRIFCIVDAVQGVCRKCHTKHLPQEVMYCMTMEKED